MTDAKRKIGGGKFLKRLLLIGLLIWVVVNPLDAATSVHNVAFWIHGLF